MGQTPSQEGKTGTGMTTFQLPTGAQRIVDNEIEKLLINPAFDLDPKIRLQLYETLGPVLSRNEPEQRSVYLRGHSPALTTGQRIQVRAAILTAQKVAALWELACMETDASSNYIYDDKAVTEDNIRYLTRRVKVPIEEIWVHDVPRAFVVQHILEMAELALAGKIEDYRKFTHEANEWWQIYARPEYNEREYFIKWAAQEALYLALRWQAYPTQPDDYQYRMTHDDISEYLLCHEQAPAGLAMLAYAAVFDNGKMEFDPARRREFWCWWLSWAIPKACQLEG
jgi:hypothetical protein